ncbi:hypothetical protein V1289_003276 [Bradyrhizobium sp. AZCC 2289]
MPECGEPFRELDQFADTEFAKNEFIECLLSCCDGPELFVTFVCQRHLYDTGVACGRLAPQEAFFSSCFDWVVTNEGATRINFDTTLTGTPFFLSRSAKAIKIIHCGPVMPSTLARNGRSSSRQTLMDLISHTKHRATFSPSAELLSTAVARLGGSCGIVCQGFHLAPVPPYRNQKIETKPPEESRSNTRYVSYKCDAFLTRRLN